MVDEIQYPVKIDLNQFKLHLDIENKIGLTLLFDSPSRRFYLSLIAFVVNQMKKSGKITSIPLQEHLDLIVLLNKTVGSSAGSSEKENLLTRIYRKWKDALPNLEEAPLFRILGRKKEYSEGVAKTYQLTEAEKDLWANLFEYKGSKENARLRFSIDRLGVGLDDVAIIYEGYQNGEAWERFIASLRTKEEVEPTPEPEPVVEEFKDQVIPPKGWKIPLLARYRWVGLIVLIGVVIGAVGFTIWRIYWRSSATALASPEMMAFPLPDKPSIAVLPFENMSDDPKQAFFSDGMTEEIITALSKSPYLFVIARNSTYTYKGKPVKVNQVAEELGVRYVLEGSVRRSGENIRIAAQLVDAIKGYHIWAERYDRSIKEIFALQDEITMKIMRALHVKLHGEKYGKTGRGTTNVEAFLKTMEGLEHPYLTKEHIEEAQKLFEEAIALDPNYAKPYALLGCTYIQTVWLRLNKSSNELRDKAIELGQKALSLDETDASAHAKMAYIFSMTGHSDRVVAHAERAMALDPNSPEILFILAHSLNFSGRLQESIPIYEKGLRIDPFASGSNLTAVSGAYLTMGQYDKALELARKSVERDPKGYYSYISLARACILAGHDTEARRAAAEVLKINPSFTLDQYAKTLPFKDDSRIALSVNALRKAGLK
jgi:adenylate cyclase